MLLVLLQQLVPVQRLVEHARHGVEVDDLGVGHLRNQRVRRGRLLRDADHPVQLVGLHAVAVVQRLVLARADEALDVVVHGLAAHGRRKRCELPAQLRRVLLRQLDDGGREEAPERRHELVRQVRGVGRRVELGVHADHLRVRDHVRVGVHVHEDRIEDLVTHVRPRPGEEIEVRGEELVQRLPTHAQLLGAVAAAHLLAVLPHQLGAVAEQGRVGGGLPRARNGVPTRELEGRGELEVPEERGLGEVALARLDAQVLRVEGRHVSLGHRQAVHAARAGHGRGLVLDQRLGHELVAHLRLRGLRVHEPEAGLVAPAVRRAVDGVHRVRRERLHRLARGGLGRLDVRDVGALRRTQEDLAVPGAVRRRLVVRHRLPVGRRAGLLERHVGAVAHPPRHRVV